jgi:hypothetical protein
LDELPLRASFTALNIVLGDTEANVLHQYDDVLSLLLRIEPEAKREFRRS